MTPKEITQIIEGEINGDWSISNLHGCDLKRCLVLPQKKLYFDPSKETENYELWLVLEECPETTDGYKIVFGEERKEFGLAMSAIEGDCFLGFYGTFLETYESM
jgi:hypothetical protein